MLMFHMMQVYPIRENKFINSCRYSCGWRGRLQPVNEVDNGRYYRLTIVFMSELGWMVLNTFNEMSQLSVRSTSFDCFLRTKMDVVVIDDWLVRRDDECFLLIVVPTLNHSLLLAFFSAESNLAPLARSVHRWSFWP